MGWGKYIILVLAAPIIEPDFLTKLMRKWRPSTGTRAKAMTGFAAGPQRARAFVWPAGFGGSRSPNGQL